MPRPRRRGREGTADMRLGRSDALKRLDSKGRGEGMYVKNEMWGSRRKNRGTDGTSEAQNVEWSPLRLARAGWLNVTPVNSCLKFTRSLIFFINCLGEY